MCLDFCRSQGLPTPSELTPVSTPLVVPAWEKALEGHPDRAFVRYIVDGLSHGFRIGFNRRFPLRSAAANMGYASLHAGVVSVYLKKELAMDRMLGSFPPNFTTPELHVNSFGVIPKGHDTGKWRLITDLSFTPGHSVNDGVDPLLCSLSYTAVDHVAEVVVSLGVGALLAKVDIESAYRLIPVRPEDRLLQAMQWRDQIYVDPMLPFGLRSAPKIFNASSQGRGATPIRLNVEFRADLAWRQCFVKDWNGVSFLPTPSSLPEYTVASDASGQWGCGAWFTNLWFQLPWDKDTAAYPSRSRNYYQF